MWPIVSTQSHTDRQSLHARSELARRLYLPVALRILAECSIFLILEHDPWSRSWPRRLQSPICRHSFYIVLLIGLSFFYKIISKLWKNCYWDFSKIIFGQFSSKFVKIKKASNLLIQLRYRFQADEKSQQPIWAKICIIKPWTTKLTKVSLMSFVPITYFSTKKSCKSLDKKFNPFDLHHHRRHLHAYIDWAYIRYDYRQNPNPHSTLDNHRTWKTARHWSLPTIDTVRISSYQHFSRKNTIFDKSSKTFSFRLWLMLRKGKND